MIKLKLVHLSCYISIFFFVREDGELQQEQNCIFYLATWMLWAYQRGIYNTVIMLIR